jgi:hypothetical protein
MGDKVYLVGMLRAAQYEGVDFGDEQQKPMTTIQILLSPGLVLLLAAKWIEVRHLR